MDSPRYDARHGLGASLCQTIDCFAALSKPRCVLQQASLRLNAECSGPRSNLSQPVQNGTRANANPKISAATTSFRSPWQNDLVERLIGSARHECTDHMIVFNERRILSKYASGQADARGAGLGVVVVILSGSGFPS